MRTAPQSRKRRETGAMLTPEQRQLLESQTLRYQEHLYVAADYLQGRGITEDTAVSARLGVVDEPIHGDQAAAYNRLTIPYQTRSGVVDIRYRCIREHNCEESGCAKYLGRPGSSLRLYGVDDLVRAHSTICVAEGEFDRLILHQLGAYAAGCPGVKSWKPHWGRLFEDFERILVFGDGDKAGRDFNKEWAGRFPQSVEMIQMPEELDVNKTYLQYGAEWFERILA
jgi:hypothetical protein